MKIYTSSVATLVISALFVLAFSQHSVSQDSEDRKTANEKQRQFKDLDDRFSYAYGADMARRFKAEGVELNVDLLADAMRDVYSGGEKRMPDDEVSATLELYFEIHKKRQEEKRIAAGKRNKEEGDIFLAQNAMQDGVVVTESGLQYKVIAEGSGKSKPNENDVVTVHYRGMNLDGTEFDNSYQRDEPFTAKIKKFIPGWAEALQLMTEGSKWELYIPADIAYGEQGSEPHIGPNATLVFEVELLDIEEE
ncbi:FKBP-type peptidyl-prolyl cis-trans isomerase [Proteobacteria bacterium 005FR1]|nr:FKBP-type peptidyl-prolyl cis-trans isomerase [Proteobacteria bacterium 005FR1]